MVRAFPFLFMATSTSHVSESHNVSLKERQDAIETSLPITCSFLLLFRA
jgi:hypothetical protein